MNLLALSRLTVIHHHQNPPSLECKHATRLHMFVSVVREVQSPLSKLLQAIKMLIIGIYF